MLTPTICRLELGRSDGERLPPAEPGAHITIHTPAGLARSYSVTDTTLEGWWAITVAREAEGRGGSNSAIDDMSLGTRVAIDGPSNAFVLVDAPAYLLIAGGIGITPIRAMFHRLRERRDVAVRLLYLSRSADATAYLEELTELEGVTVHHSGLYGRYELWPLLAEPDDVTHVYCCGGAALMEEVRELTMHWRPSHVHFEDFAGVEATGAGAQPFSATWAPTGTAIEVAANRTLLHALEGAGLPVESSCESGTCGTCVLTLVAGEADHRDLVLTPEEREHRIMACVSRAAGARISVGPA